MANAYVNKVVQSDGTVLIDISDATATADKILEGYTAYGATGEKLTGTATGGAVLIQDTIDAAGGTVTTITATNQVHIQNNKRVTPTSTDQTITPDTGYDALGSVIVEGVTNASEGFDVGKLLTKTLTSVSDDSVTTISSERTFHNQTTLQSISFPNCKTMSGAFIFNGCTGLTNIDMPSLERFTAASVFSGCTSLTVVVLPSHNYATQNSIFSGCSNLTTYDCGHSAPTTTYNNNTFNQLFFDACTKLNTIILRASSVMKLGYINNFRNTPFADGGSGGTIYVPSALITSYKEATNWSTIDGYGTITWAAIEGSQYENYYADGTPILA